MANIGCMKPSILQLIDEQPLRLVVPEEPKASPPVAIPVCPATRTAARSKARLRPLLLSLVLLVLSGWAFIQFWG
jgi:hypothetical protein